MTAPGPDPASAAERARRHGLPPLAPPEPDAASINTRAVVLAALGLAAATLLALTLGELP